jgi:GNAT superfamily N-acetyltransferase
MKAPDGIEIGRQERPELDAFLGERLYEFNMEASGLTDGALLNAQLTDDRGSIIAGLSGHTWGECCEIVRLWVARTHRSRGIGKALMQAAEQEAIARGCRQIVLSTHTFQAPGFYEKLGFSRLTAIPDSPKGYENIFFIKYLPGAA